MGNAAGFCMSSLRRSHANIVCLYRHNIGTVRCGKSSLNDFKEYMSCDLFVLFHHYLHNTLCGYILHFTQILILFLTYALQAFKAYCAILVRRSNFRHQVSLHVSPCESTQRRKVEPWARNVRKVCLNAAFHVTFRDLLHAVKLRHGTDGFTSPPKEGMLRIFLALKIRRLRPSANPRTLVPKTSTLPLDHRY
jgi:hypothetical protein